MSHYYGGSLFSDDPERRKWQNPEAIFAEIGVKSGITFADIGCGGGFFALPAARMVGKKGKVYALDVNQSLITSVKKQAEREGLKNLFLTAGRAEEIIVCEGCADIVFFGISLHDFQDPAKVLANARKTIKPAGRLINLDWKKEEMPVGPPLRIRFDIKTAARLIKAAGFTIEFIKDSGLYHYLVIARPVK